MLRKHAHTIAMINRDRAVKYLLRDYFQLRRTQALTPALLEKGLGQADLVLALLRLRDQCVGEYRRVYSAYIELLVGHPIVVGPRCLLSYPTARPKVVRSKDDRRIIFVAHDNPRQPRTEAHLRWCEFRVGRSLGQLLVRGVTKRDVRRALRKGWIRVEEVA